MSQKTDLKRAARYFAVQALFQMEAADQGLETVRKQFWEYRFGETLDEGEMMEADTDHFDLLLRSAVENQAKIDQMTNRALDEKWPIARIDPTLRAIFRVASAEFLASETPKKVVIDEFIELTRSFFDGNKEPKFANAVLDQIAKELAI